MIREGAVLRLAANLLSNVQFSTKCETCKETRKCDPFTGINTAIETAVEGAQMLDLTDKDYTKIIINVKRIKETSLKELKESKIIMTHQIENTEVCPECI